MRGFVVLSAVAALSLTTVAACRGTGTTKSAPEAAQAAASVTPAADKKGDPNAFTGTVVETMNSGGYTYARLQAAGKDDVWIAAREFQTQSGDRLTVGLDMPMQNFESKTLKRTFPLVYFVGGVTRDGQRLDNPAGMPGATPALMTSHAPAAVPASVEPVAAPAGGMAIADVWTKRTTLAGQSVTVRGKVVKLNEQILGRNWIHLQDGSGTAENRTNDLTVTTSDGVKLGDVVTLQGVLAIDKDFGAGYAYGAILENAKVVK
jgi:hypothetical protein